MTLIHPLLHCGARILRGCALVCGVAGLSFLLGCASTSNNSSSSSAGSGAKVPPLPPGVTLHQDKDINGVWLAPGFEFKGYDTLYIAAPEFAAIERPNEAQMRAMALRALPENLEDYLQQTKLFQTVTRKADEVKPGCKCLKLTTTVIEYEKGGGGARYWAGLFGGGQPVIKVRGEMLDGDKPEWRLDKT